MKKNVKNIIGIYFSSSFFCFIIYFSFHNINGHYIQTLFCSGSTPVRIFKVHLVFSHQICTQTGSFLIGVIFSALQHFYICYLYTCHFLSMSKKEVQTKSNKSILILTRAVHLCWKWRQWTSRLFSFRFIRTDTGITQILASMLKLMSHEHNRLKNSLVKPQMVKLS